MNCDVTSIQGHIAQRVLTNIEVEDIADAAITFENGAIYAFFACNYFTQNDPIRVAISGENGSALLTESSVEIRLNGLAPYTVASAMGENKAGEGYWGAYHQKQISDFYAKLATGDTVPFTPEDATKTLQIVLGIYQSSMTNQAVTFCPRDRSVL